MRPTSATTANKPVVQEEYVWMTNEARHQYLDRAEDATRLEVIGGSISLTLVYYQLEADMSDMFWQFGYSGYSTGRNQDMASPFICIRAHEKGWRVERLGSFVNLIS